MRNTRIISKSSKALLLQAVVLLVCANFIRAGWFDKGKEMWEKTKNYGDSLKGKLGNSESQLVDGEDDREEKSPLKQNPLPSKKCSKEAN